MMIRNVSCGGKARAKVAILGLMLGGVIAAAYLPVAEAKKMPKAPAASPAPAGDNSTAVPAPAPKTYAPYAVDPEITALRQTNAALEADNQRLSAALEDAKFRLKKAADNSTTDQRAIADLSARLAALSREVEAAHAAEDAAKAALAAATGADSSPAQGIGKGAEAAAPGESSGAAGGKPAKSEKPVTAQDVFDAAKKKLAEHDYPAAETAFVEFVKKNPGHALVADAIYFKGEAQYLKGDSFVDAAESYQKVIKAFPKSAHAPDAFVRLAGALRQLGEKDLACTTLIEFGKRYPKAPEAAKARAASEGRAAGCGR